MIPLLERDFRFGSLRHVLGASASLLREDSGAGLMRGHKTTPAQTHHVISNASIISPFPSCHARVTWLRIFRQCIYGRAR